ncbi:MAG: MFS transporter, partial [Paracoccaceae bacterium]|nr:MFS transporter [Paracoccaceae bacterium]
MDARLTSAATYIIMAVFFLQPLALGGWLALIPLVKADLGLSKGELAIALIGMPIALIPSLQIAGRVVSRFGPRRMFKLFFPAQGLAILLPLLAWNVPSLFAALFAVGAA